MIFFAQIKTFHGCVLRHFSILGSNFHIKFGRIKFLSRVVSFRSRFSSERRTDASAVLQCSKPNFRHCFQI